MADETYCPYCGASMKANATFCPSCGAQIAQSAGAAPAGTPMYGQQNSEKLKAESSAKTIGIISIVLGVIGLIVAIIYFASMGSVDAIYDQIKGDLGGDVSVDEAKAIIGAVFVVMGVASLILAITGFIGGRCCLKKQNYGLGLAMYIIALVLSIFCGGVIGIIIAVVLLIFYTKTKPAFE